MAAALMLALGSTTSRGAELLHWKLDEPAGDYTVGGYKEEISGNTTISKEVVTGTDITEGAAGLAPDGGTAMTFQDLAIDTYIDAGAVENTGTYVANPATTPKQLGNNYTICAWFRTNTISGEHVIFGNLYTANNGILVGITGNNIYMDLGNTRIQAAAGVVINHTYFLMAGQDPNGAANFGWSTGAKSRLSLFDADALSWKHFDFTISKSTLYLQGMNIGRFSGSREWNGTIDDVRVYNETLSQDQANSMVVNPAVFTLLAPDAKPTGTIHG